MSTHPRTLIKRAAVAALQGLPSTGARVFPSRIYPYNPIKEGGAGLMVYTLREESAPDVIGPNRSMTRQLDLSVETVAQLVTDDELDDYIDGMAKEVEEALLEDLTLNGTCKEMWLISTEKVFRSEGEVPTCGALLTYRVYYRTVVDDGEVALEDADENIMGKTTGLQFGFEGNGQPVAVGKMQDMPITFDCMIIGYTILIANPTIGGSITFDVVSDSYGNFPPTSPADSICGGNKPQTVASNKAQDMVLTNWDVVLPQGSTLRVIADANDNVEDVTITFHVRRTN